MPYGTSPRGCCEPRSIGRGRQAGGNHLARSGRALKLRDPLSPDGSHLAAIYRRSPLDGVSEFREGEAPAEPTAGKRQSIVLWDLQAPKEPRLLATTPEDFDRGGGTFSSDGKWFVYPSGSERWAFGTSRRSTRRPK